MTKPKPKKIVVPYDGSKPAEKAIRYAVELANDFSAPSEIILLNVAQEIVFPPSIGESPRFRSKITGDEITTEELAKELGQQMKEAGTKMLDEKRNEILAKSRSDIGVQTKVLMGSPAEKIIEFASHEAADLIVIGNVGLSGVSKFRALGSVSRAVGERASCPVIIVH
jgi:nucleotide-binding universal stress UspA family protein